MTSYETSAHALPNDPSREDATQSADIWPALLASAIPTLLPLATQAIGAVVGPRSRPAPRPAAPVPSPGAAAPPAAASPGAVPGAAGQLLQLLQSPALGQLLSTVAGGRSPSPVSAGGSSLPASAILNLVGSLFGRAGAEAEGLETGDAEASGSSQAAARWLRGQGLAV